MTSLNRILAPLVLLLAFAVPVFAASELKQAILAEEYERASELLDQRSNSIEKLFFKGYSAFKRGNYSRARSHFEKLVENNPDSNRAEDASYFLDRIKLRSPSTDPPDVRVQLAEGEDLSGSVTGPVIVRRTSGETLTVMSSGQNWSVQPGYLSASFTVAGESYTFDSNETIVFQPTGGDGVLVHREVSYRGKFHLKRTQDSFTLVNVLPLDKYLFGVVRKEIAPGWPMETVKAQSVAARSFALSKLDGDTGAFDLKSSHLAQVYGGMEAETPRVRRAVKSTRGEVLTHGDRIVPAYFHANSGGHIETAEAVWNRTKTPYIVSKTDTWSENTRHSRWSTSLSIRELQRKLTAENYPEPAANPGLRVGARLRSGRSQTVSYRTGYNARNELSANNFRMAVGPNNLKSTWIETIERSGSTLEVSGRGWGHGIGMSQWGAHAMGQNGVPYRDILGFYYENAQLMDRYGLGTRRAEASTDG